VGKYKKRLTINRNISRIDRAREKTFVVLLLGLVLMLLNITYSLTYNSADENF
jgi:Co/Zn/Cd efflux system component